MKKILVALLMILSLSLTQFNTTNAYASTTIQLANDSWTKTETYTSYYQFSYGEVLPTTIYDEINFQFGGETGIEYQFSNIDSVFDDGTDDSRVILVRSGKPNVSFLLSSYFGYYGLSLDHINESENNEPVTVSIKVNNDQFLDFIGMSDFNFEEVTAISIVLFTDLQASWFSSREWRFQEALENLTVELVAPTITINYFKGFERIKQENFYLDEIEDIELITLSDIGTNIFVGWATPSGRILDLDDINLNDLDLGDDNVLNLHSRFETEEGTIITMPGDTNAPMWLQNTLSKMGLNNTFGYIIIYIIFLILALIGLASLNANYFINIVVIGALTVMFNVFGLLPLYALIIITGGLIMIAIYLIKGGTEIE